MTAGIAADRLGRFVDLNEGNWVGQVVLHIATRNLRTAYTGIGLTERFEETARRFAARLGFTYEPRENKSKVVPDRPEADDLSSAQRDALRRTNRLDVELYEVARTIFTQKQAQYSE
jgi:hypothetical protein